MKHAVIYVRVSTEEQAEGSSLDVQESACREYCTERGLKVKRVFRDEGASAKDDNRPQFKQMRSYCLDRSNKVDHIVVHKSDRFARAIEDYYYNSRDLREKAGVTLLSATEEVDKENYVQKFLRGILAQVSELDNDVRRDRSRKGMVDIAKRGGWCFRAPIGYNRARLPDGLPILEPDLVNGPLVQQLFDAMAKGRYTTADICEFAASIGLRSERNGSPLCVQTVHKILQNKVYAGIIVGNLTDGQPVQAAFSGLVSEETFNRVQAALAGKGHIPTPHLKNNPAFPLRRFVLCGECGKPVTASNATGRSGKRYPQYRCATKDCRSVNIRAEELEAQFMKLLYEVKIESSPLLQKFREYVLDEWQLRHAETIAAQAKLKMDGEKLTRKQALLLDKMLEGTVDENTYRRKNKELSKQIAQAKADYLQAAGEEWDIEVAIDLACLMVQNAGRLWVQMKDVNRRQRLQKALFPEGLEYGMESGFGTVVSSYPVRVLRGFSAESSKMAPPRGIEPRSSG